MISFLKGIIIHKSPTRLILDVNGVGFDLNITLNCAESLGTKGETITILTYLHVREDSLQLFGFSSTEERETFLLLISTSGIGPKKALAILSGTQAEDLRRYIMEENLAALTTLPGVGRRTAQRLILELKEKFVAAIRGEQIEPLNVDHVRMNVVDEAVSALISLGYSRNAAQAAIQTVIAKETDLTNIEELIKKALRKI